MAESVLRLIKRSAEFRSIDEVRDVPKRRRGLYVLYKRRRKAGVNHFDVVYVGMARTGMYARLVSHTDWERPFQNLRATRSTELIQLGTPIHNYCRWLGHSIQVALRHYAQTRPEDVQRAVLLETMPLGEPPESPCSAA